MKLQPRDAAWVYMEQANTPLLSVALYIFDTSTDPDGAMKPDEVRAFIAERVPATSVLTRKLQRVPLDLEHPSWVKDPEFDVGDHVETTDADGGGWSGLRGIASDFVGRGLVLHRPPWEMQVVTGLVDIDGAAEAAAVLMKFHHSVGDGAVTLELARQLFASIPTKGSPGTLGGDKASSGVRSAVRALTTTPKQLRTFVRGIRDVGAAAREVKAEVEAGEIQPPPRTRPATRFNRSVTPGRSFDAASFMLDDVRSVKEAAGNVTINDVALTIVAGALRGYLREVGEEPEESLAANVPMSLRSLEHLDSANQFTPLQVELHTDIADPLERLRAVHTSAARERDRKQRDAVLRSESLVDVTPGFVVRPMSWLSAKLPTPSATVPNAHVGVTNVARGGKDMWLRKARAVSTYGAAALSERQGLTHAVHSLDNTLTISVLTDPTIMADPAHYVGLIRSQFDALAAAVGTPVPAARVNGSG
ncbi:wax ester/triacylglycerol synthase family O-acyltransferase [Rhodococcus sp. WS4]|nr:wax ester/triacylglycerol synthase family O-acyltransferase [Rhodococcus sp. WS4]